MQQIVIVLCCCIIMMMARGNAGDEPDEQELYEQKLDYYRRSFDEVLFNLDKNAKDLSNMAERLPTELPVKEKVITREVKKVVIVKQTPTPKATPTPSPEPTSSFTSTPCSAPLDFLRSMKKKVCPK